MKILVAEDDRVTQQMLVRTLESWSFEVVAVGDGRMALDALLKEGEGPKLALLDWMMPEIDGLEVCKRLRASPSASLYYIILLSGKEGKEAIVQGLNAGADDYLVKPYDPEELRCRVQVGERILILQAELRRANDDLRELASRDSLTQLLNRRSILERVNAEVARSSRENTPLAVAMIDLDHFKNVNDTYGHQAGDTILREFAERLSNELRRYDSLGRYGGEEFLLILPGIKAEPCQDVVDRLRWAISNEPIAIDDDHKLRIFASFGVAWLAPGQACKSEDLIRLADDLMYKAKEGGRNRVEIAPFSAKPLVGCS